MEPAPPLGLLSTRRVRILAASTAGALLVGAGYLMTTRSMPDRNLEHCESTKAHTLSLADRNRCLAAAAKLWSRPQYCEDIKPEPTGNLDRRAECRSALAEQLGDLELCKQSGQPAATQSCLRTLAVRAEAPALCRQFLQGEALDSCLLSVAMNALRSELCLELKKQDQRADCLSNLVGHGADEEICASIADPEKRDRCYLRRDTNPVACSKVTPERRAGCLNQNPELLDDLQTACEGSAPCLIGLRNVGPSACALIPDDQAESRDRCFQSTLNTRGARSWIRDSECTGLGTQRLRDECFFNLGKQPEHPAACRRVSNEKLRQECLFFAGKLEASGCLALRDVSQIGRCVAEARLERTLDDKVCGYLPDDKRSQCQERVSANLEKEFSHALR